MLEYVPSYNLKIAAEDVDPDCLASELWNRLKLRPGDERSGRTRHVTGNDFGRNSTDRCGDSGTDRRIIIDFSADQCRQSNGGIHSDELSLQSFFFQVAPLLSQWKRNV